MPDYHGGVAQLGEHLPCKQGVMSSNLTISIAESNLESPSRQAPDELRARRFAKLNEVFSSLVERTNHHTYLENRILNQRKNILFEYQDIRGTSKDVKLKNNLEPRVQRYAPEEMEQPVRSPSGYLKACGFSITFASQMSVPFENSP